MGAIFFPVLEGSDAGLKRRFHIMQEAVRGIANILGDRRSKENSFGLVSLCSVGPVLAVLVMGLFSGKELTYPVPDYSVSGDIAGTFLRAAAHTCREVAVALFDRRIL